MLNPIEFNVLLVPVDFSDNSRVAFAQALGMVTGEKPVIILLHVIDSSLPLFAEKHELGSRDEVAKQMRKRAEAELQSYLTEVPETVEVDVVVTDGVPFLEILQMSNDFAVDAIVMSKLGDAKFEELLFGSTAEKVIRGCSKPVLILPP